MSLDTATWLCGALSLAAAVAAVVPWVSRYVAHAMFAEQILKLVRANNVERAIKLCKAAPRNPMVKATGKVLAALNEGGDEPASETIARLRQIYLQSIKVDIARASSAFVLAIGALAIAAVAIYLVVARDAPTAAIALPLIAILLCIHAYRTARKLAVESAIEGERILPVIASARNPRA
jgi:hypothetical protein